MQIIGDTHGNVVWIGERDCSAQRRHQKLIEESPGPQAFPADDPPGDGRGRRQGGQGVRLLQRRHRRVPLPGRRVLVPGDEHPPPGRAPRHRAGVGHRPGRASRSGSPRARRCSFTQDEIDLRGWAIEVRVNAEDPAGGKFLPSPGRITALFVPQGFGIRWDGGYTAGDEVSQYYDNLVGKLIVWGSDRDTAIARMIRAIREFRIEGIKTTLPADLAILAHEDFRNAEHSTKWVEDVLDLSGIGGEPVPAPAADGEEPEEKVRRDVDVEVNGKRFSVVDVGAGLGRRPRRRRRWAPPAPGPAARPAPPPWPPARARSPSPCRAPS